MISAGGSQVNIAEVALSAVVVRLVGAEGGADRIFQISDFQAHYTNLVLIGKLENCIKRRLDKYNSIEPMHHEVV